MVPLRPLVRGGPAQRLAGRVPPGTRPARPRPLEGRAAWPDLAPPRGRGGGVCRGIRGAVGAPRRDIRTLERLRPGRLRALPVRRPAALRHGPAGLRVLPLQLPPWEAAPRRAVRGPR